MNTAKRTKKLPSRIKMRTASEKRAFSYFPDAMKDETWRNRRVRFARCHVYYPDLILPEAKVVIEIDGDIHTKEKQQKKDKKKDKEFTEHGYAMIRIKNEETVNESHFLYRLYNELILAKNRENGQKMQKYIKQLEDFFYTPEEEEYMIDESDFPSYGISVYTE